MNVRGRVVRAAGSYGLVFALLVSCASESADRSAAIKGGPSPVITERGDAHVQLPLEQNRDIMQAKLAHAHAILEGMALEDYQQIQENATALRWLAQLAEWRVHTTVAYGTLSAEFREAAGTLVDHAREKDLAGVTGAYASLTTSCINCHTYLRREGLYHDVPGRVSRRHAGQDIEILVGGRE